MVSWTGSKYKYDLDLSNLAAHSMYYFTALVVASYSCHLLWRLHKWIVAKYGPPPVTEEKKKED